MLPSSLKKVVNLFAVSGRDSLYLAANDALDCGEMVTITVICLLTSPF